VIEGKTKSTNGKNGEKSVKRESRRRELFTVKKKKKEKKKNRPAVMEKVAVRRTARV
jgi:hypothetical protein